ncbi:MAG: nucleic acid-binding protein [Satyrvirus sp.]|uniref:Nucleic acid-binding protein n=1 Tax=Satyrvirus sp. TaxID=2487771 RepID=A0A3G5AEE1_9VIRU|nr:MAG: nucleic acid-binding protein [Satyrvirus sp.]
MPKNKGAGGKNRRKGKAGNLNKTSELVYKEDHQEYGQVVKSLGNDFMEIMCFTNRGNITKRAHIRGKMRKRVWLSVGDIVLVNIRDFEDRTCDIILKYSSDEARILRNRYQLPDNIDIGKSDMVAEDDLVVFGKNDSDDVAEDKIEVPKQTRSYEIPDAESSSSSEEDNTGNRNINDL